MRTARKPSAHATGAMTGLLQKSKIFQIFLTKNWIDGSGNLKKKESFSFLPGPGTMPPFIEVDRDANGRLSHVIFATQSIQESKIKELKAKQKLKAANEELTALLAAEKQHTAIIGSLSSVFFALYYIDLEKITFQEVISLDSLRSISGVNALLTDLQT